MRNRIMSFVLVGILVLAFGAVSVYAAATATEKEVRGTNYVDEDGDGVCDNAGNSGSHPQDGSGSQNGQQNGSGHGYGGGRGNK